MHAAFVLALTLSIQQIAVLQSASLKTLIENELQRRARQQGNNTSPGSGTSSVGGGQSQLVTPPQQLVNPDLSSGGSSGSPSSGANHSSNPGGNSGGGSQQLTQQKSPLSFVDPSFQLGGGTQQQSQGPSFINPSMFLQPGSAPSGGTSGSNFTSGGSQVGQTGSQLFQPPKQFIGQGTGSSGQFNLFNPINFITGRK